MALDVSSDFSWLAGSCGRFERLSAAGLAGRRELIGPGALRVDAQLFMIRGSLRTEWAGRCGSGVAAGPIAMKVVAALDDAVVSG